MYRMIPRELSACKLPLGVNYSFLIDQWSIPSIPRLTAEINVDCPPS